MVGMQPFQAANLSAYGMGTNLGTQPISAALPYPMPTINPLQSPGGMSNQAMLDSMMEMTGSIGASIDQYLNMLIAIAQQKNNSQPVSALLGNGTLDSSSYAVSGGVAPAPAAAPAPNNNPPSGELYPNQGKVTDPELKSAGCGLLAAMAFVNRSGKNVSLEEVKRIAQEQGLWSANSGMKGPDSEYKLLKALGLNAGKEDSINWDKIAQSVQSGKPVIISTPQHYWVVEGYNPATGKFNFGNSAQVKGLPQEMTKEDYLKSRQGDTPTTALYLN